ncbi:MAG: hypothetical protein ACXW27_08970 [Allosphingosinicella sp.]
MGDLRLHSPEVAALAPQDQVALASALSRMRRWIESDKADPILLTLYDPELEALAIAALGLEAARG